MELKHFNLGFAHRWTVAIWRVLAEPWERKAELDALYKRVRALESECNFLRQSTVRAEAELLEKRQAVGALVQWIKITHRLDVPPQANTMRKLLEEFDQPKPFP